MSEKKFTAEFKRLLKYIKGELLTAYPIDKIGIEYFIISVIDDDKCIANQMLENVMLSEAKQFLKTEATKIVEINSNTHRAFDDGKTKPIYDTVYDNCINYAESSLLTSPSEKVNSGHILIAMLTVCDYMEKAFAQMGVNSEQLIDALSSVTNEASASKKSPRKSDGKKPMTHDIGEAERSLVNLNNEAIEGRVNEVIGNDDIINEVFRVLSKCERNNVVITGKPGVGKTDTVKHIANLLVRDEVPLRFRGKKLLYVDFTSMSSSFGIRGGFETKFKAIIEDASKRNNYILFIDDIHSILSEKAHFSDMSMSSIIDMILSDRNIDFICTASEEGYSSTIQSNNFFKRRFHKISLEEKNEEQSVDILKICKWKYEFYHNVTYTDDAINTCVKMVKRYIKDSVLPDAALDILDSAGADKSVEEKEDERVLKLEEELGEISTAIINAQESHDGDLYDKLVTKEIEIKSKINKAIKDNSFEKKPKVITADDILNTISRKAQIPVTKLSKDERSALSKLEDRINQKVIGQQEAVSETVRTVKRQRIGIGKPNKPSVMMFIGNSGTGKTYLAKTLASEVFGDENAFVRLDMSEYNDQTSVNKIMGSSPGYIGYEKGGILTEAIKKRNHCVLLLDEIEKADESVFDVFLQLFDDGRLTDNKGYTVDFSNVIVIMTSNVGAKEASLRGKGVGFIKNEEMTGDIIKNELRKKFKPEFINRIDNIIMFNNLSDENLRKIISLEVDNVIKRIRSINYNVNETFAKEASDLVYKKLKEDNIQSDFGARPINRIIQHEIEDKITDYIIENNPDNGFELSLSALF